MGQLVQVFPLLLGAALLADVLLHLIHDPVFFLQQLGQLQTLLELTVQGLVGEALIVEIPHRHFTLNSYATESMLSSVAK